ncbi:hypothetical protein NDN08_004512 [Rhodosorus marinus]|uniref:Gamma tubulin complex component C-terminal domain-containing protein n=1 Tax=Rhodosorus marinus TaxID=101924 RepID=A0AAV8ULU9_9RHOD|nr:hypothetical protein NDN08_004512 [Rhodosorus marinus]
MGVCDSPVELVARLGESVTGFRGSRSKIAAFEQILKAGSHYEGFDELAESILFCLALKGEADQAEKVCILIKELSGMAAAEPWANPLIKVLLLLFRTDSRHQTVSIEQSVMNAPTCNLILDASKMPSEDCGRENYILTDRGANEAFDRMMRSSLPSLEERSFHSERDPILLACRAGTAKTNSPNRTVSVFNKEDSVQKEHKVDDPVQEFFYLSEMPPSAFESIYSLHFGPEAGISSTLLPSREVRLLAIQALSNYGELDAACLKRMPICRRKALKECIEAQQALAFLEEKVSVWLESSETVPYGLKGVAEFVTEFLDSHYGLMMELRESSTSTLLSLMLRSAPTRSKLLQMKNLLQKLDINAAETYENAKKALPTLPSTSTVRDEVLLAYALGVIEEALVQLLGRSQKLSGSIQIPGLESGKIEETRNMLRSLRDIKPDHPVFGLGIKSLESSTPMQKLGELKLSLSRFLAEVGKSAELGDEEDERLLRHVRQRLEELNNCVPVASMVSILVAEPCAYIEQTIGKVITRLIRLSLPVASILQMLQRCFMLSGVDRVPSAFRKWVSKAFKWEVFEPRHLGVIIESAWIEWAESCFDALQLRERRGISITTVFANGSGERTGLLCDYISFSMSLPPPLSSVLSKDTVQDYGKIFQWQLRIRQCVTVLGGLFLASRHWDAEIGNQADKLRCDACVLVNGLQAIFAERVELGLWKELYAKIDLSSDSTLEMTQLHKTFLTESMKWCFLDKDSSQVNAAISAVVDAVLALECVLEPEKVQDSPPAFMEKMRLQASLSLLILAQTLQNLVSQPDPLEHHVLLLQRIDLNGFTTDAGM